MVNNIGNNLSTQIFIPNLYHAWKNGPTALPVNPALAVYAHFKHVVGVPSANIQSQVPINKLRLLDTLIDQLSKMQTRETLAANNPRQQAGKADSIEAKIKYLQQELNRALQTAKPVFTGQYNTQTGMIVNLYA
jgi:hypothetical protein